MYFQVSDRLFFFRNPVRFTPQVERWWFNYGWYSTICLPPAFGKIRETDSQVLSWFMTHDAPIIPAFIRRHKQLAFWQNKKLNWCRHMKPPDEVCRHTQRIFLTSIKTYKFNVFRKLNKQSVHSKYTFRKKQPFTLIVFFLFSYPQNISDHPLRSCWSKRRGNDANGKQLIIYVQTKV